MSMFPSKCHGPSCKNMAVTNCQAYASRTPRSLRASKSRTNPGWQNSRKRCATKAARFTPIKASRTTRCRSVHGRVNKIGLRPDKCILKRLSHCDLNVDVEIGGVACKTGKRRAARGRLPILAGHKHPQRAFPNAEFDRA